MKEYSLKVAPEQAGMRLDVLLAQFCAAQKIGLSRTVLQELILKGRVKAKNLISLKPHYKVKINDEFKIIVEEKEDHTLKPENIPLEIIYQDQDLAVVNKPPGLVVHPAPGNYEHTLVNALLYHIKNLSSVNPQRPGIVHRLDKGTSGLLVVAKNDFSHLALARQFAKHSIKRKYIAIVKGKMEFDENTIELPIGRHPLKRKSMAVGFSGGSKAAVTHYRTLKRQSGLSVLELEPFTGRTHQLRVHLAFLGHPILGDEKYGKDNPFGRLALHAQSLGFLHPRTGKFIEFSSPVPGEFEEFIKVAEENKTIEK